MASLGVQPAHHFALDEPALRAPSAAKGPAVAHAAALDGLRGLAILLVIVPHLSFAGLLPGPPAMQRIIGSLGHGVDLFFVLSGFGLALPLIEAHFAKRAVRLELPTYAFNRLYRILPPFYAGIVLAYLCELLGAATGRFKPGDLLVLPHSLYDAVAPLLLLDHANIPINPNLWTIAIQMRWYLFFPLLIAIWIKSPRFFVCLLACAWIAYPFTRLRTVDLGTIPLFMLGIIAAHFIVRRELRARFALVLFPLACLSGLLSDARATIPDPWGVDVHFIAQPTTFAWQVAAFALVLIAAKFGPVRKAFSASPLVSLGRCSFSLYIVHQPVIAYLAALHPPIPAVAATVAIFVVGMAFWWCIERPLIDGARRRRLRERAQPFLERGLRFLGIPPVLPIEEKSTFAV